MSPSQTTVELFSQSLLDLETVLHASQPQPALVAESIEWGEASGAPKKPLNLHRRAGVLAGAAIASVAGIGLNQLADQPTSYKGSFQLLVEPAGTGTADHTVTNPAALTTPSLDYASQMQVLWSPKLLSPVVQQLQSQYADLNYETLSQKLDIAHRDGEKTLEITYQDTDPKKVQAVLETVSQAYLQYSQVCRTSLCRERDFVERRLPQLQQQVTIAKQKFQALQQQHGMSEPTAMGRQLAQRLTVLTQQQQDLQIRLTAARTQVAILEKRVEANRVKDNRSPSETSLVEQALQQNDRYQTLLAQFQTIANQLTTELARPQPDSTTLPLLKQHYQEVSAQMTQVAQQPIAAQLAQAIGDFQAHKTTDYTAVIRQQTLLEGVTAAIQVQVLRTSEQAIAQTEGQIKQQIQQWAALARQYDALNLELKFATDNLNLYEAKRAELQPFVPSQTPWQLNETSAVEPVSHRFTFSDPEHRLSLELMLSFLLVVFVMSIAEQTRPLRSPRQRRSSVQPEFSWQADSWQPDSWQTNSWQPDYRQTPPLQVQFWQQPDAQAPLAIPSLLPTSMLTLPLQQYQRTTLFLLTAANRIETLKRAEVAAA